METSGVYSHKRFYVLFTLCFVLCRNCINTELASLRTNGDMSHLESIANEVRHIQERVGTMDSSHRFLGRQTAGNVSLNQLADNLNRLEGNLASLIQSFLALQRSVFNLEQLQELLVLLLEDILKQSASMDPARGGGANGPRADPTTSESESRESLDTVDYDNDKGVDSAQIDEDGDDAGPDDTDGDGGGQNGGTNGGGNGGGVGGSDKGVGGGEGGRDGNQGTEPFGALRDGNIAPSTTLNRHTHGENRVVVETKPQQTITTTDTPRVLFSSGESADEGSSEMAVSGSMESIFNNRILPRANTIESKPVLPIGRRESVVSRKSPATNANNEPLVNFASQLEERLHDLMRRLSPLNQALSNHHGRMALMRHAEGGPSLSSVGESPMAPPPAMFEPVEVVAVNDAISRKDLRDAAPIKVKLHRQLNPIISHGGPLVGPEDFSSPFMENLGSDVRDSGESLNERSTGMIDNMLHHDQDGASPPPPSAHGPTAPPATPSQLDTLPSATDRRRRQTKGAAQAAFAPTRLPFNDPSSSNLEGDEPEAQSSFVNLENSSHSVFHKTQNQRDTPLHSTVISNSPKTSTVVASTNADDFDALIADLLHDLSQHLKSLDDQNKDQTSLGEDIDRAVIDLNTLIWIPSTTPVPSIHSHSSISQEGQKLPSKTFLTPTKSKNDQILNPNHRASFPDDRDNYILAGAHMGGDLKNDDKQITTAPKNVSLHQVLTTQNATNERETIVGTSKSTTDGRANTGRPASWDWLRQIPMSNTGSNNASLERLVSTLTRLSKLDMFSQELNAISRRGQEMVDAANAVNTNGMGTDSDEEFDSVAESPQSKDINSADTDMSVPDYEMTTAAEEMDSPESKDKSAELDAMSQHNNGMLGNLDEKQVYNVDSDTENKNHLLNEGEESFEDKDDDDKSSNQTDEHDRDDEIDESKASYDKDQNITNSIVKKQEVRKEEINSNINTDNKSFEDIKVSDEAVHKMKSSNIQGNDTNAMSNRNSGIQSEENDDEDDDNTDGGIEKNENFEDFDGDDDDEEEEEDENKSIMVEETNEIMQPESKAKEEVGARQTNTHSNEGDMTNIGHQDSTEIQSSERERYVYSVGDHGDQNQDDYILQPPAQYDDLTALVYNSYQPRRIQNSHRIFKRETNLNHKNVILPLLSHHMRKSNVRKQRSHRIKKRQVPSFWEFLYGGNAISRNLPSQQFGSLGNQGQNLENLFSLPSHNTAQTRTQNIMPQPPSHLNNPQFPSLHHSQFGESPNLNYPQEQPSLNNLNLGQSAQQTPGKNPLQHLHHQQQQQQNLFGEPQRSHNFPFHPPIGGYPQYHGYQQRFHYPQFGYPGGYPGGSTYEPGESPAAEAAADMEEILTNLFQRYWENVRNLFTSKGQSTTPEFEYEGPVTTPTTTTTTSITTTKVTTAKARVTTPTTVTTATRPTTMKNTPRVSTQKSRMATMTSPGTVKTTVVSVNATEQQNITHFGNLTVNFPEVNLTRVSFNNSTNATILAPSSTSTPAAIPTTVPNAQPERGSTLFFNLIKSLQMITHRPSI